MKRATHTHGRRHQWSELASDLLPIPSLLTLRVSVSKYGRSDRLPFSVGLKLFQHPHLRSAALLCFLAFHGPGYALHGLFGISHTVEQSGCCGSCGSCAKPDGKTSGTSSEIPNDEEQNCAVCELLAIVATVECPPAWILSAPVGCRNEEPQPVVEATLGVRCVARGPPRSKSLA